MKEGFVREVYLRSTPSVDLDLVPEGEQVDCNKHTIKISVYDQLREEYCENKDDQVAVAMFMLQQGPKLIEG